MERIRGELETFPLAVLRRDVKTLYVALIDTHEKNHGRGIRIFEEGGVKVEVGLQEHLVGAFLKPYLLDWLYWVAACQVSAEIDPCLVPANGGNSFPF